MYFHTASTRVWWTPAVFPSLVFMTYEASNFCVIYFNCNRKSLNIQGIALPHHSSSWLWLEGAIHGVSVECTTSTSHDRNKANWVPNGTLSCLYNFPCREGMNPCEFVWVRHRQRKDRKLKILDYWINTNRYYWEKNPVEISVRLSNI